MGNSVAGHDKVLGDIMVGDLDNCPFEGRINFRGRKELEDYELQQSIKIVNDSVTRTNRITLIIAVLAAIFSLTSVIIALTKIEKIQVQELQQTNSILQKQVKILDSLQQRQNAYQNANQSHKDSLNK